MKFESGMFRATSLLLLLMVTGAAAQEEPPTPEELEAQHQAFKMSFQEIVNDMNMGDFARFNASIDRADMLQRIFGLRLIDQKIKKQFREDFHTSLPQFIESAMQHEIITKRTDDPIRVKLLGFASRGNLGRAVVRFDLAGFQANYHEYDLRLTGSGTVIIVDWIDFYLAEKFSDGVGEYLVRAAPQKSAVRKLVDFRDINEKQVFQLTELVKTLRDNNLKRYFEVLEDMDDRMRRQRIVVVSGVQLAKQSRKRRELRIALTALAEHFGDDPLYTLMLLDYYFPTRKYEEALQSLLGLQARLDVDDGLMQARLSSAALVLESTEDANAYADRALELEPDLELAWWAALRARAANSDYDTAVAALAVLEKDFGHALDTATLQKDPSLKPLTDSSEFQDWVAAKQ